MKAINHAINLRAFEEPPAGGIVYVSLAVLSILSAEV